MKPFVIVMSLILLCPSMTLARSLLQSDTAANSKCAGLARACSAAADEIVAARKLIEGYENQIVAHDARIEIARKEIETLKSIGALEAERAAKLEKVIAAEREAKSALLEKIALQEKRIAKLDGQVKRWRKFALITGVVAGVAILIGVRR